MKIKNGIFYGILLGIGLVGLKKLYKSFLIKYDKNYKFFKIIYSQIKKFPNENVFKFNIRSVEIIKNYEVKLYITITEKNILEKKENIINLKSPFLPPFDDDIYIGDITNTHRIIFNKYMLIMPHILIITKKYEDQNSNISDDDINAIYNTLKIFDFEKFNDGLLFYNRGDESGASQKHKHFQVIPKSILKSDILLSILKHKKLKLLENYKHSIKYFKLNNKNYFNQIKVTLNEIISELSINENTSYNLIMDKTFIAVFIRKSSKVFEKISVNSIGILGNFLVKCYKDYLFLNQHSVEDIFNEILLKIH